ncbi:hypothetical protein H012_gp162 [Acanthamoeba polyphaga moumouvirus]|uniref:Uncharacterized protein n=2 Tax=Moumouvirus TaxID=3080801 RepID=L7RDW2_9VIRU|nr:hypothetical protein H012_gp162 [Acanthamoeba polyphaga moumouvirus]AEX62363.1 hypothetical protein mv_R158 [Moumouvirus Monve]AGC02288.1 hypothetical protein Moumou_00770 [Acanthamoeba polyphaga moumouvirus]AQN68629.1 hypothetical protein [Saudi moumouvirus]
MCNLNSNLINKLMESIQQNIMKTFIYFVCILFFFQALTLGNPVTRIKLKNKQDIIKCYRYSYCYNNLCICENKDTIDNLYCWNEETCYVIKFKECIFNIFIGLVVIFTFILHIKAIENYLKNATPEERTQLLNDLNQQFNERNKIHYYDNYGNIRVKMPGDNIPSYSLF